MVTPTSKPAELWSAYTGYGVGATDNGDHVFFHSQNPVIGDADQAPYLFRSDRGTTGWTTTSPIPKGEGYGSDIRLLHFSQDLSVVAAAYRNFDPADSDGGADWDFYRFPADGSEQLMSPNEATSGTPFEAKNFQAATADGRGIVFDNVLDALVPAEVGHPYGAKQLYEFRNGQLRSVGVDDSGVRLTDGDVVLGGTQTTPVSFNAYSRDGSRIYFTTRAGGGPSDQVGLWLRVDGTHTEPVPAAPAGANANSQYVGATPDGRKAFFVSDLQLTTDDHDSSTDLYEYDAVTKDVTRLSASSVDANVQIFPVWSSDDGRRVYFTVWGQLLPGQGNAGDFNTYLYDDGQLRFVAGSLLMVDPSNYATAGASGPPACGPTRVSPDGRYLLAQTPATLTAGDTDGGAADVYRYDAVTNQLALISSGPADPEGGDDASINPPSLGPGTFGCDALFDHVSHPMSDDGKHVFFETRAPLVNGDTNGKLDVYSWSADTQDVSLISSGSSDDRSDLLDATPDGSSVFFATRERLVARDKDVALDVYAARVGGGFAEPSTAVETPCRESECQGKAAPTPSFGQPGSRSLVAPSPTAAKRAKARLRVRRLSSAALRRLLETGRLTVRVSSTVNGRISVSLAAVTSAGSATACRGSHAGVAGRTQSLTIRCSRAGRRLLARHRRVVLVVRQSGGAVSRSHYVIPAIKGASR